MDECYYERYYVMKRRLEDGFALPLAVFDNYELAKAFITAEVKEKSIPSGYEEYIETRVLDRRKSLGR